MYKSRTFIILFALIVICGITFFGMKYFETPQHSKTFHAVFLTNDQVYFGQILEDTDKTLTLTNVYYLKANAEINPPRGLTNESTASAKLALVKLGEELHSPKDKMTINKEQMLFSEEMESSGTIMDAINKYEQTTTR